MPALSEERLNASARVKNLGDKRYLMSGVTVDAVQASGVWLGHADRFEADALTFRAGAGPRTSTLDGKRLPLG